MSGTVPTIITGLSVLFVLAGIATIVAEERKNGKNPFLWLLAVLFVFPLGLGCWFLIVSRESGTQSDALKAQIQSVTLGVCLLVLIGLSYLVGIST